MERPSAARAEVSRHSRNESHDDRHPFSWEIDRVEHEDGRITGEVMRREGLSSSLPRPIHDLARRLPKRGHKWMRAALKA